MLRISKKDKGSIIRKIHTGEIDKVELSTTSLIDDIILSMHRNGILDCVKTGFGDKRKHNTVVPFELILTLATAAKMRVHTSLSDIPYALTSHQAINELGYSLWNTNRDIGAGLMSEGTIRALIGKYNPIELIEGYNLTVQNHIMPKMKIQYPHT